MEPIPIKKNPNYKKGTDDAFFCIQFKNTIKKQIRIYL